MSTAASRPLPAALSEKIEDFWRASHWEGFEDATPTSTAREAAEDRRRAARASLDAALRGMADDAERYQRINTPELFDFVEAVRNEALHQRERWGADGDAGKTDADWFWLIGYLAGKALHNPPKDGFDADAARLHRIITVAAAAANWHAATLGTYAAMRPGIDAARAARPEARADA